MPLREGKWREINRGKSNRSRDDVLWVIVIWSPSRVRLLALGRKASRASAGSPGVLQANWRAAAVPSDSSPDGCPSLPLFPMHPDHKCLSPESVCMCLCFLKTNKERPGIQCATPLRVSGQLYFPKLSIILSKHLSFVNIFLFLYCFVLS